MTTRSYIYAVRLPTSKRNVIRPDGSEPDDHPCLLTVLCGVFVQVIKCDNSLLPTT